MITRAPPRGSSYFLSGVMQGAKADGDGVAGTVNQDYRRQMKDAILAADESAIIIEPWDLVGEVCAKLYPDGTAPGEMFKDDEHVRSAFGTCVRAAAEADVIVSYLPEASMGSAVELHAAHAAGRKVLAVAPSSMANNWVVRSYSDHVFANIAELRDWLASALQSLPALPPPQQQTPNEGPCSVRAMDATDGAAILAIYKEGLETGHATFQHAVPTWEAFDASKLTKPRLVAVGRHSGGDVLGWATLSAMSSRPCYAGVGEVSIYVRGDARGHGVGRALMEALVHASEAHGMWMLVSSIFPENAASAAMHARAGFRLVGRRKRIAKMEYGPLQGQWRDTLWLERRSPVVGME